MSTVAQGVQPHRGTPCSYNREKREKRAPVEKSPHSVLLRGESKRTMCAFVYKKGREKYGYVCVFTCKFVKRSWVDTPDPIK